MESVGGLTEIEALREAIGICDEVWGFDAARGLRDDLDSMEYERMSPAPALRRMVSLYESLTETPTVA